MTHGVSAPAERDERICIIGMGYVGLTLAAVMAERGFHVVGAEIRKEVVAALERGESHFYERNLELMMRRGLASGRLRFTDAIPKGESFDVYVVTVGTPLDEDGHPRLDMVENVTREIAGHMKDGALVVLRSTLRLGTSRKTVVPLLDGTGKSYDLAFCPERTTEGNALTELYQLPQIIGGDSPRAVERATKIFRALTPTVIEVSSLETAEIIKLLDNSFRDVFFSFGNEVALMAEKLSLDAHEIIRAANTGYPRTNIARPGFVGGPCLHKDPHILMDSLRDVDFTPKLIRGAREINECLVDHVLDVAESRLGELMAGDGAALRVSVMGLAFKGVPETDDTRNSPSVDMVLRLKQRYPAAEIRGQDYVVSGADIEALGLVAVDEAAAFEGAHLVLLMNNHHRYGTIDVQKRSAAMARPGLICDCWNVLPYRSEAVEGVDCYVLGA